MGATGGARGAVLARMEAVAIPGRTAKMRPERGAAQTACKSEKTRTMSKTALLLRKSSSKNALLLHKREKSSSKNALLMHKRDNSSSKKALVLHKRHRRSSKNAPLAHK